MKGPVGIVGVGNMGGAMAARLLEMGWSVRACDLVARKVEDLARLGAQAAASPPAAAAGSAALIVCVVDALQCEEVLFGPAGAAAVSSAGTPVLLCPTIAPEDVEGLADRLGACGLLPIDAPMSGGPQRARDGSMSLMLACGEPAYQAAAELVAALSGKVFRVGTRPGDGARTKLVNNLLAGINLAGAAEAMVLAQRLGLDLRRTLHVIEQSSGQSWIGSDRMRRAIAGDFEPRAHLSLLQKDTRLAVEAGLQAGFEGTLGPVARDLFEAGAQAGLAHLDDAALFRLLAQRA
jgi:3-hydroxyisobutyrate dehydrogenase